MALLPLDSNISHGLLSDYLTEFRVIRDLGSTGDNELELLKWHLGWLVSSLYLMAFHTRLIWPQMEKTFCEKLNLSWQQQCLTPEMHRNT